MNAVAASTLAADSLVIIDQQVATILGLNVPFVPSVSSLQPDVTRTQQEAHSWPATLRAGVVQALQAVEQLPASLTALVAAAPGLPTAQLVARVQAVQQQAGQAAANTTGISGAVGQFRAGMSANIGALTGDLSAVQQQIAQQQQQIAQLNQQINAQQQKIDYYKDNPWLLIALGLTIVGLIVVLQQMQAQQQQIAQEEQQINQTMQALQPLLQSQGPLASLLAGIDGLAQGLLSLNTAVMETSNALNQLQDLTVAPAIIVADLQTIVQTAQQAAAIAQQILGTSS